MLNKKLIPILAVVLLLVVFIPQHWAKAGFLDFVFSSSTLGTIVNGIATLILNFLGKAISFFAGLLDNFIQYQTQNAVYQIKVVDQSWTIIRDFVNMFFILILIVMAFGTIFSIEKYNWKSLLAPFIIAALLINFSLTIGQYIVTVANDLSGVFLKHIQQAGGVSNAFASGSGIVSTMTSGTTNIIDGAGSVVITAIFAIIFLAIIMLAFATTAIFTIVRLFALWFLLIVSPLAWLGYAIPNLRSKTWSEWWKQFLCWCFFLPYFLFFVMFAVIFIKNSASIPPVPGSATTAGLTGSAIMLYGLSLTFLIGGMVFAKKLACTSGTYIRTVFSTVEGGVRRYAPGAGYVRSLYGGAKQGVAEKGKEIQEKGVFGIGGAQAERLRQAKVAEFFGARGAGAEAQAVEINKELTKLKQLNLDQTQLNQKMTGAKGVELLAMRQLRAENGWVPRGTAGTKEIEYTIRSAGERSKFAQDYINTLAKNNYSDAFGSVKEMEDFAKSTTILSLKKSILETMTKNNDILSEDMAKLVLDVFKSDSKEKQDKIKEGLQKNIKNFAETRTKKDRAAYLVDPSKNADIRRLLAKQMSEDGEISSYKQYHFTEELLGGSHGDEARRNADVRKVFDKLGTDDPITQAEVEFRRTLADSSPAYTLTPAEMFFLSDQYAEKMKKTSEKQLADLPKERWASPGFEYALIQRFNELETRFPAYMVSGKKGVKRVPGGGERFKKNLIKILGTDPDKRPIIDRLP